MSVAGSVPVVPLKRLISGIESGVSVNADDTPAVDGQLGVLKTSCVYSGKFDVAENKTVISADLDRVACPVRANTLVVSRMNTPDLVGAAGIATSDEPNIYLPDRLWQVHFDLRVAVPRFIYWWTRSELYRDQVKMACAGTSSSMQNLNQTSFRNFSVPRLTPEAQQGVANFLDDKTARIDALIAEKEHLTERLAELRQTTISSAVTIKDVDSGWRTTRLKFLVQDIVDTEHKTVQFYDDGAYLVARTSNIKKGRLVFDDAKYTDDAGYEEWTRRAVPKPGDILFTREAPAGEACLVPEDVPLCLGQRTVLIRLRKDIACSSFVLWSLYGGVSAKFIADLSQGSTVAHFNMPDIGNIPLLTGPLADQRRRVDALEDQLRRLEDLVSHTVEHISRLREYRSSLISAAVTGQLDINHNTLETT